MPIVPRFLHRRLRAGALVLGLALASLATAAAAVSADAIAAGRPQQRDVTVMSWNLYLGAKLQPLITATPATLPAQAQGAWDHTQQVDFPARAEAVARTIARARPDLVGLQEVALWERGPTTATLAPVDDYLRILTDALIDRGLHYRAAATSVDFRSPPLPIASGGVVRFTERSIVLVRTDAAHRLAVTDARDARFAAGIPLPGSLFGGATLRRGWASIDVRVGGGSFRFVDTHLEAFDEDVRSRQADELAHLVSGSPLPTVVVGDLNVQPTDPAFRLLTSRTGLMDAWAVAPGSGTGDTASQPPDLDQPGSQLTRRIDYVLYQPGRLTGGSSDVVGDEPADRTPPRPGAPFGLWPSDHAGVVATLRVRRGRVHESHPPLGHRRLWPDGGDRTPAS